MGQTTSNTVKKVRQWGSFAMGIPIDDNPAPDTTQQQALARWQGDPFVYTKTVNMYKDKDGWVAHEFYEQRSVRYKTKGQKSRHKLVMRRVCESELIPVTEVPRSHPALHVDMPVILCEAVITKPRGKPSTKEKKRPRKKPSKPLKTS